MVRLSELSDPSAVLQSIAEFRASKRDNFLTKYGFGVSRDYFLRIGDELFDTKPIVAAAYGLQFPERGPLTYDQFSGGPGGAVKALRRLGFEVVTRAQVQPPTLGNEYESRTAIWEAYGGDKQGGIIRLPGDIMVNVFSDAEGPYADDPPTLAEPFGYRGEGLNGPHRVEMGGNALLEHARIDRSPVRFWYRPTGKPFSFLTWCVVLGRNWIIGRGQDGGPRPELDWQLQAVSGPTAAEWSETVVRSMNDASDTVEDSPFVPEAAAASTYAELLARVDERGQVRRNNGIVRTDFARSAAARRAVLTRSGGKCESATCTGMPPDTNRRGEPILDVDHIRDLALGGDDHPRNMVALCPNCHACKTRGADAARWRRELARIVLAADALHLAKTTTETKDALA